MKRYIRHIIGPVFFILIMVGAVLFVTSVHFGVVTIDVLELVSGVGIEYDDISGNLLKGFRVSNYRVRLSETDSICGARADIQYRFDPFMLRLPNLFEINLVDPKIAIQRKASTGGTGFRGLPNLRLGLRVNLKNGQILYRNGEQYTIDRISGIVFLDLVGRTTRLATMNLSLQSLEHSIYINSLTLDAEIDDEQIRVRSFRLSGSGLALEGTGYYDYSSEYAAFDIARGSIDLKKIKRHEGIVDFEGAIAYDRGNILPKIRGAVVGSYPFTEFGFETNASADTIWLNVFDCKIMGGQLFAQLRVTGLKAVQCAMNFKDVDVSGLVGVQTPILSSGYVSYVDGQFSGFVGSPDDMGLGLDSVFFYGSYIDSEVWLDSLFVAEGRRSLYAHGAVLPDLDVEIEFSDFEIDRFKKVFPVAGRLSGSARITGQLGDPLGLSLTSDLSARGFVVSHLSADSIVLQSTDFQQHATDRRLSISFRGLRYGDLHIGQSDFSIDDSVFHFVAAEDENSFYLDGLLRANLEGVICSLLADYNGVLTRSIEPIWFDIPHGTLGDIRLALGEGLIDFSRMPLSMELTNIDLSRIGRLLGFTDSMAGMVDVSFINDSIDIRAREVCFMGLVNGVLLLNGHYADGRVSVESLHIHDDKDQILDAHGTLSMEYSEMSATFSDVGVWVLAFLENFLGDPDGLMTGEVSLRGNIDEFEFGGGGRIHDGSFSVDIIAAQFDSVDTDVVFEGNKILFLSGKGLMSPKNGRALKGQWINGGGVVKLEERFGVDDLNFDFSFVEAPLQFPPFAYGIGTGNFSLTMRDRIMYYSGNITVAEAVIPLEFGMKIEEEQAVQGDEWYLNLRLKADRNVWLRNPDADIEFGGELSVIREEGPVFLSGVLETDRGNYYWVNHILTITQGKVTFIPGDEIDPDLDFWAELDTREGITIILHLFGPISEPIFEFYTDPPGQYTEQDIVTYLNLNITWQELEQLKRGEYMSRIIPLSLLSWLEGDISRAIRQYTGLDYFHLETPFFEENEKTKLTVGKFIARNLFITYTHDITTFSNEFNVEYFIDDRNKIQVERDETGEYSLQYQYRLRF